MVRQARFRAGAQGIVHVATDVGRGGHVLVSGGHRVRRHRDVRKVVRRRSASSISVFGACHAIDDCLIHGQG